MNVIAELNQDDPKVQVLVSEFYYSYVDQFTVFGDKWDSTFFGYVNYMNMFQTIKKAFICLRYAVWEYLQVEALENNFLSWTCVVENEFVTRIDKIVKNYEDVIGANFIAKHSELRKGIHVFMNSSKIGDMSYEHQVIISDWIISGIKRFPSLNRVEIFAALCVALFRAGFDLMVEAFKDIPSLVLELRQVQKNIAVAMEQIFKEGIKMS